MYYPPITTSNLQTIINSKLNQALTYRTSSTHMGRLLLLVSLSIRSTPNNPTHNNTILFVTLVPTLLSVFCSCRRGILSSSSSSLSGKLGISLFWGTLVSVLIMDWHGSTSLNGWIQWSQIRGGKKLLLGFLWFGLSPLLLGIYLIRVLLASRRLPQQLQSHVSSSETTCRGGCWRSCYHHLSPGVYNRECFWKWVRQHRSKSVSDSHHRITSSSTPTMLPTLAPTNTPLPTSTPKPIPTPTPISPTPTSIPAVKPTQPPAAKPTQPPVPKPTPPPVHTGVNGNPWGYDFNQGNLIYNPPPDFCTYFNCIASFWKFTNGYVDECNDGTYSHSGGVTGACSKHGGEMRPLYSH